MTFSEFISNMMLLSVFLLLGYIIRELIPALNKIFLPASVIGGILALLAGPQVIGIIEIPEMFSTQTNALLEIVIVALTFGLTLNRQKLRSYADIILVSEGLRMSQLFVGGGLGILLCLIFPVLPKGWGTMGLFSFCSGHPSAAMVGGIFEEYGVSGNGDIGMVLSTIGLIAAMVGGMIYVNYGIRKGWATYTKTGTDHKIKTERGLLAKEKQHPIGTGKIYGGAMNNLMFQFAIIMVIMFLGHQLHTLLGTYVWSQLAMFPDFLYDVIICFIIWPILSHIRVGKEKHALSEYYDKPTASSISGFALDMMILGAVATMNLSLVATYWLPLLIYSVIMIAVIFWSNWFFPKKLLQEEWFEKSVFLYGQNTGVAASGLALLRALDPETRSMAYETNSIASIVQVPFLGFTMSLVPMFAVNNSGLEVAISAGIMFVCLILAWIFFRKKVRALGR